VPFGNQLLADQMLGDGDSILGARPAMGRVESSQRLGELVITDESTTLDVLEKRIDAEFRHARGREALAPSP
jgi:hypothetical protein